MSEISKVGTDLIYLVSCALNSKTPDIKLVEKMNLESVYSMAHFHSLTACIAMPLAECGLPDSPVMRKFKQAKEKSIRKNILLDNERNEIFSYMEKNGIWYLPLKGIILQELYPKFGMRQMADNDILYDSDRRADMIKYMKSRGYNVETDNTDCHDECVKPPVYNFELHTSLFGAMVDNKFLNYFMSIKDRLLTDNSKSFGKHLSDEDFYIYNIAHAYKHYSHSGTGLRTLADCYVYWQKKGKILNESYINAELEKLGISDFEYICRSLSLKLFSQNSEFDQSLLTDRECEYLDYFLNSGTYGTQRGLVKNRLTAMLTDGQSNRFVKLRYFFRRIFLPLNEVQVAYPFYYRHKVLIPVLWIIRIFKALFFRRNKIKNEINILNSTIADEKSSIDRSL